MAIRNGPAASTDYGRRDKCLIKAEGEVPAHKHGRITEQRSHHRIADLAGYVPGKHRIPKKWPSKRYDLMYVFKRLGSGTEYSFQQLAQPLLGDDRRTTLSKAG